MLRSTIALFAGLVLCGNAQAQITISNDAGAPVISPALAQSTDVDLTNVDAGDTIVGCHLWYRDGGEDIDFVQISGETAFTMGAQHGGGQDGVTAVQCWCLPNVTASGSVTIDSQMTASVGGFGRIIGAALGGDVDTTDCLDAESFASNTGTNATSSLTTTNANSFILSIVSHTATDPTAGSGYTIVAIPNDSVSNMSAEYDLDAGAAGAKTVDYGGAASGTYLIGNIAINAAGGGGGSSPVPIIIQQSAVNDDEYEHRLAVNSR